MQQIVKLEESLVELYNKSSQHYSHFDDSWIAEAVYQFDYVALGKLLSELNPLMDGREFRFSEIFDGHNAFEEFVCLLLRDLFQDYKVVSRNSDRSRIDLVALNAMMNECKSA